MRALRILVAAFLAGALLASCRSATAACSRLDVRVDTLGWVVRPPADTVGPITATLTGCIELA